MLSNRKYKWLLWVSITLSGMLGAAFMGMVPFIVAADHFFLTTLTIVLYLGCTGIIGWNLWKDQEPSYEDLWFVSDLLQIIGILGTVAGMILLFNVFLENVDATQTIKEVIPKIAAASSVAFYTTFAGLLFSVFLKIQLKILDR